MSRTRTGQGNFKRGTLKRLWGTSRAKKTVQVHLANGLLLAHYKEESGRICEDVSWLPGASQFDPHPSTELVKHGYSVALLYMGARLGGTSQFPLQRAHLDPHGHEIFYQVGGGRATSQATRGVVANFIKENIIARLGVPHRIINDNDTPFVNKEVRKMLEYYQVKHYRSSPYYIQGNGQAEATNKILIKTSQEYSEGWVTHLANALWAYRSSPKFAIGFSHFSLVYRIEAISPVKLMIPSLRVM